MSPNKPSLFIVNYKLINKATLWQWQKSGYYMAWLYSEVRAVREFRHFFLDRGRRKVVEPVRPSFYFCSLPIHILCLPHKFLLGKFLVSLIKIYSFYMRTALPAHIYVYHMSIWCLQRSEEGIRFLRTGVIDGYKPTCRYWASNLGPLQEQQMLLTSELQSSQLLM